MRLARVVATALLGLTLAASAGCPEWLEVDDDDASSASDDEVGFRVAEGTPSRLPDAPAEASGPGPIVPRTPGLRVPDAGYWTRVRLDVADVVLSFTWIAIMPGEGQVTLRLEAVRSTSEDDSPTVPSLAGVIPIALPPGTDASQLAGLTLGEEALSSAVVSLRTTWKDTWLVELTRLNIEHVDDRVVKGTLEGMAKRGAKGRRERRFEAGFLALRAR
ncbi:MAG: hypothetical protein KC635_08215 [Myxococcales bacterium]|nr:hypothetical protein [Myxococcales bacterium]MCB9734082.1 hypothetical protein [Deltaproteobacteria bacterium]